MSISSMTGFARTQGGDGDYLWAWEARSTNGRNLDIRMRVPPGFEVLEPQIRSRLQKKLQRGSVSISLQCQRASGGQAVVVNEQALRDVMQVARDIAGDMELAPPSADGLLALKGVLELVEPPEDRNMVDARNAALLGSFDTVLDDLLAMRGQEGEQLQKILLDSLGDMKAKTALAASTAATQPKAIKARFQARLAELLDDQSMLQQDRLEQEVAVLAMKADVREELDRLATHIDAAVKLIEDGGPVGRRMDFLAQELNREANTLCAKSADKDLTATGLEIKALIDQLREQVQNLE